MSKGFLSFYFGDKKVRVRDRDGGCWFIAKDVCACLDLDDTRRAVERLDADEWSSTPVIDARGRQQDTLIVSEAGLYRLIMGSRKPEAKLFQRWVAHDVLPSISAKGSYTRDQLAQRLEITNGSVSLEINGAGGALNLVWGIAASAPSERTKPKENPPQTPMLPAQSSKMRAVLEKAQRYAASPDSILILGETGTGKSELAKQIHAWTALSGPAEVLDCAAASRDLIESEIFGYVKGAFTGADRTHKGVFERAHGGTLFIDEIGELPLKLQPRLLRVLQEGVVRPLGGTEEKRFDVRIIAATNRNLAAEVAAGRFREDLFYRLSVLEITMPPLRDCLEDIPDILKARGYHFNADIIAALKAYHWPGNIRDLLRIAKRINANEWDAAAVENAIAELKASQVPQAQQAPQAPAPLVQQAPQPQQAPIKPTRDDRWRFAVALSESRKDADGWWSTSDLSIFAKHPLPTIKRDTQAWVADGRVEKRGVKQTTRYRVAVDH